MASAKNYRTNLRKKLIEKFGGKCTLCGSIEDLQFDHVDPSTKSIEISNAVANKSESVVWKEAKKCQLLCGSCHQEKSLDESGRAYHGSLGMYSHSKCRCNKCKEAWNIHSREYRRARRKKAAEAETVQASA